MIRRLSAVIGAMLRAVPGFAVGVLAAALCPVAVAQNAATDAKSLPVKPIRLISPYAAGGGSDTLARIIGQKLLESWQQPVVVDNRPSSGGNLGAELVAKAAPDGYTLFVTPSAVLTINPHLYARLRYDTFKDFAPVIAATNSPYFLVVHPKIPASSVKELIAYAKANAGKLNYSSSGNGSSRASTISAGPLGLSRPRCMKLILISASPVILPTAPISPGRSWWSLKRKYPPVGTTSNEKSLTRTICVSPLSSVPDTVVTPLLVVTSTVIRLA